MDAKVAKVLNTSCDELAEGDSSLAATSRLSKKIQRLVAKRDIGQPRAACNP